MYDIEQRLGFGFYLIDQHVSAKNRVVERILPGEYIQLKQLINKLLPHEAEGGCRA